MLNVTRPSSCSKLKENNTSKFKLHNQQNNPKKIRGHLLKVSSHDKYVEVQHDLRHEYMSRLDESWKGRAQGIAEQLSSTSISYMKLYG